MKKTILYYIYFSLSVFLVFSEDLPFMSSNLVYPDDLLIISEVDSSKIILGQAASSLLNQYEMNVRKLLAQYSEPKDELWRIEIDNNILFNYRSSSDIVSYIASTNADFKTSRDISIGNSYDEVLLKYGQPTYSYLDEQGRLVMIYSAFIPEINNNQEYSSLFFTLSQNVIIEIALSIDSGI